MTILTGQPDETTRRLLERAIAGEEAAFARIVAAYHDDMTRVSFVISGDLDLTDEAVQQAWSIVWRKLETLRDADRLRPWLVSVAANETRQSLRRRRRHPVTQLDVTHVAEGRASDPAGRNEDIDLANALGRLDPRDRELLALRYVAGFDSTELSKISGRSPGGTRARLSRLLDQLRTELHDA